jgi:hypothetical protein
MSHQRGRTAWLDTLPPISEQSIDACLLRIARRRLIRTLQAVHEKREQAGLMRLFRAVLGERARVQK